MKYKIRIYIMCEAIGLIVNDMVDSCLLRLTNSFDGAGRCLAIYDVETSSKGLKMLIAFNISYFPLNQYGDFRITCPACGEVIEDDMIQKVYDENLLSGYNIKCDRHDCGMQMADVEYLLA